MRIIDNYCFSSVSECHMTLGEALSYNVVKQSYRSILNGKKYSIPPPFANPANAPDCRLLRCDIELSAKTPHNEIEQSARKATLNTVWENIFTNSAGFSGTNFDIVKCGQFIPQLLCFDCQAAWHCLKIIKYEISLYFYRFDMELQFRLSSLHITSFYIRVK